MNGEFELGFVIVTIMVVVLCMLGGAWCLFMVWWRVSDMLTGIDKSKTRDGW